MVRNTCSHNSTLRRNVAWCPLVTLGNAQSKCFGHHMLALGMCPQVCLQGQMFLQCSFCKMRLHANYIWGVLFTILFTVTSHDRVRNFILEGSRPPVLCIGHVGKGHFQEKIKNSKGTFQRGTKAEIGGIRGQIPGNSRL